VIQVLTNKYDVKNTPRWIYFTCNIWCQGTCKRRAGKFL